MKAIILAAGQGTRLGKYTKDSTKGMLKFNGKTLIDWQIETLHACNIKKIIIVRGFKPENTVTDYNVTYHINREFLTTNMVHSLLCADNELNDDVIVCYSDILYEKRIIDKMLECKSNIMVAVDKDYFEYWNERVAQPYDVESLVIDNDRIVSIGDNVKNYDNAMYRYIGIIRLSKHGCSIFKKEYNPLLKSVDMTRFLQILLIKKYKITPVIVSRGWLEFDTVSDYWRYNRWLKEGALTRFFSFQ